MDALVHLRCCTCGYDLYSIDRDGHCPECGTPIDRSMKLAELLQDPQAAALARRMARSMLIASVFAGLCPASLYLVGTYDMIDRDAMVQRGCLLAVIFAVCCAYAIAGERIRRRLLGQSRSVSLASLAERTATMGLGLIAVGALAYGISESREEWSEYAYGAWAAIVGSGVGVGFFLVGISAWRAAPAWLNQSRLVQVMGFARLRWAMVLIGWIKAIYETLWLALIWVPAAGTYFRVGWIDDHATDLLKWAGRGLAWFGVVWALMVFAHGWQLVQIRRATRPFVTPLTPVARPSEPDVRRAGPGLAH